jgi:hypothetical protein
MLFSDYMKVPVKIFFEANGLATLDFLYNFIISLCSLFVAEADPT